MSVRGQRRHRNVGTAVLLLLAAAIGCGRLNAIVGGECADGYVDCTGQCVDEVNDPTNCGQCGNVCPPAEVCVNGTCAVGIDGARDGSPDSLADVDGAGGDGSSDGPTGDGLGGDGSSDGSGDSAGGDASVADGSGDASGNPDSNVDGATPDACSPPYDNVNNCGSCGNVCVAPNDTCLPSGGTFVCGPACVAPQKLCFGSCVDWSSDPDNCGACGAVCDSFLCTAGICQGAVRGDIVYLGFDYQAIPNNLNISQARELVNAVFLANRTPIRVLAFQKYAAGAAITNVTNLLVSAQASSGRTIQVTPTIDENVVTSTLTAANYDVFLVYDQQAAPAGTMPTLGTTWASVLGTFTQKGGVFITMDGASGANPQMPQFETNAGLLTVSSHATLVGSTLVNVVALNDAVGKGVATPYGTRLNSVRFGTEANGGLVTYVAVEPGSGQPNVVHKIAP